MVGEVILIATAILLFTISIFLFNGKCSWLIAGYNTASKEEKVKYDEKKLCKAAGFVTLICAIMLCFMAFMGYKVDTGKMSEEKMTPFAFLFMAAVISSVVTEIIYVRKKCKVSDKKCIIENVIYKEERKIDVKNAKFKFILTDEKIRKRMFEFYGFDRNKYNPEKIEDMNINWAYGVYDEVNGVFITVSSMISDCIARCDVDFYDYLVLTDFGEEFTVSNNKLYNEGRYDFKSNGHFELENLIKKGIEVYNDSSLKYEFEKEVYGKIGKLYKYKQMLIDEMYEKSKN